MVEFSGIHRIFNQMGTQIIKLFRIFLILVAIHSFCVGLGLIVIPLKFFGFFGFEEYQGAFFKIQGGVFHLVMCGVYIPAALDPLKNRILVRFAIFAKFTATLFLLTYALLHEMVWMVLLSGIMDFVMGGLLLWFDRKVGAVD